MADIAINPVTRRVQFTGNTGTGPFAFTFNILADEDIAVYKNTTLLTLTTHYSVTTNANGTGSITLVAGQALISSDVLTIIGGRDLSRTTDFVTAGDLLASSLNEQLDSLVIMTQQLDEKVGRTIKTNPGDVYTDLELPTKDNRKGTVLGFNATSGDPEVGPTIADVSSLASITADIATLADIEDGTDATDAIQTVAGISSNVSTVAGISSNVTTVAGNTSNINAVAADATDIGTVAGSISNVNTVAGIDSNITTVAGNTTNINTVAGNNSNITTVAGVSANVTTVAGISSDVTTVAGISSDVTTVAADGTDIGTVATNIADVNTVASNIATISAKVSKSGDTMTGDLTIQGNLTVSGTTITVDSATAQTIDLGDGDRMRFGDSNDAYIEWNGTYFDARSTGRFDLLSSGNDLRLSTATNVGLIVNHTGGTPAVQLYNSGVERLATTSTGVDITGTLTSDGLTVDGSGVISDTSAAATGGYLWLKNLDATTNTKTALLFTNTTNASFESGRIELNRTASGQEFNFYGNGNKVFTASNNGDISFYEDTGTTPKFFWDASAESLGIGTTSLSTNSIIKEVHINSPYTNGVSRLRLSSSVENMEAAVGLTGYLGDDALYFAIGSSGDGSATERMRIDSSGNVGIGTSSPSSFAANASNLVVGSGSGTEGITVYSGSSNYGVIYFADGTSGASAYAGNINYNHADNSMRLGTNGSTTDVVIDSSGSVGIGTSSIGARITLGDASSTDSTNMIRSYRGGGTSTYAEFGEGSGGAKLEHVGGGPVYFKTGGSEAMRIDSSGNLLVGRTTSALGGGNGGLLQIGSGSGGSGMTIHSSTTGIGDIQFADGTTGADSYRGLVRYDHSNNSMQFRINASERMRIDSSGNLLHNKTSSDATSVGTELRAGGSGVVSLVVTSSGTNAAYFNRLSSNGTVVNFAKDDTTVGSIQSVSGVVSNIILDPRSAVKGSGLRGASSDASEGLLLPIDNAGNLADGTITLGQPSSRFKDLYLSGGVYLGGTGSANHLDDYEEGTWTPTLSASTTAPTVSSYDTRVGQYTKVGDTVTFIAVIRATLSAAGSGSPRVTGLPFASTTSLPAAYLGLRNILSGTPSPYISSTHVQIDGTSYVTSSNLYLCVSGTYKA